MNLYIYVDRYVYRYVNLFSYSMHVQRAAGCIYVLVCAPL
jgi:hypothetical protein